MIRRNFSRTTKFAHCKYQKGEEHVQSGQSITPAQMWELAQQGKPIASHILPDDQFDDGDPYATYDLPLDRQRGIDVVEMWEASKDIGQKFDNFKKKGVNTNVSNG